MWHAAADAKRGYVSDVTCCSWPWFGHLIVRRLTKWMRRSVHTNYTMFRVLYVQSTVLFFLSVPPDYSFVDYFSVIIETVEHFGWIIILSQGLSNSQTLPPLPPQEKQQSLHMCVTVLCARLEVTRHSEEAQMLSLIRKFCWLSEQKVRLERGCINFPKV